MVQVTVNKGKVLFTTTVFVDGKEMELSVTKYADYFTKEDLTNPSFENAFYWSEEAYKPNADPLRHHNAYRRMVETDYNNQNDLTYQVQWKVNNMKIDKQTTTKITLTKKDVIEIIKKHLKETEGIEVNEVEFYMDVHESLDLTKVECLELKKEILR
jgi:hypothetical protein